MSFIEEFYFGNLEPQKSNLKQNADFQRDFNRMCEIEAMLRNSLADEQKELFREYVDLWGLILSDMTFDSFKTGFRYGAGFAAEAFGTDN